MPSTAQLVAATTKKVREHLEGSFKPENGPVQTLEARQKASRVDRGPSSSTLTCQCTIKAPQEADARDRLLSVINSLGDAGQLSDLTYSDLTAEWVSAAPESSSETPQDSPESRFDLISKSTSQDSVVLFVHGGGFFLNGLGTSRHTAAKLSKASQSRVLVLDYRLAPQSPFPSALLDVLVAYLTLISPPPGSYHQPIPASSIVLAGESSGGNLCVALVQLLLQLRRQSSTMTFNGQSVRLDMPAGAATLSCAADMSLSCPDWMKNRDYDVWLDTSPFVSPPFPADRIWPSNPPRGDVYCETVALYHPLVSPCISRSWQGAPPLWFAMGQERLADAAMLVAQTAARQGVPVVWKQYERMPHCWPFILPKIPQSTTVMNDWAEACRKMLEGKAVNTGGQYVSIEMSPTEVDVKNLTDISPPRPQ